MFSEMEYPHWMMVAGAWLVVAGFIGLGFSWYMNRAPAEENLHPAAPNSSVEGEEMSALHSSAGLWKPEEDDQLRALAASGERSFEIGRLLPSQSFGRPKARLASRNNGSGLVKAKGK